ncbi:MAG: RodZ domain-containing protein [Bryobacteraceae bacterium]
MDSPGTILRRARSQQGLELAELAARIKINRKYLEAMEADNWKNLPGGFFYKSFVRQYAGALGLSAEEIEAALAGVPVEEAPLPAPPARAEKSRLRDLRPMTGARSWGFSRMLRSVSFLLVVVVGCGVLYTWWHRIENHAQADAVSSVINVQPPKQSTAPAAVAQPVTSPVASENQPAPAAQPPAQASAQADPPAGDADGVRLTLAATEDTWVRVTADGKTVFAGVIKSQESRNVEGKESTRVRIGNAGGVQIEWNGRQLGNLGKRGEIRDVLFTKDGYKVIEKEPSDDDDAKPEATT